MKDLNSQLEEILRKGFDDLKKGSSYYEATVPAIKSLITQTIQECLPDEQIKDDPEYSVDRYDFLADGFNMCRQRFIQNLRVKGLEI